MEDRRQRELAYADLRTELGETKTLLRFMVLAAQDFNPEAVKFGEPPFPPFSRFAEPDVVNLLKQFDLACRVRPMAPYIGYQPIMPPGDTRPAIVTISTGAQGINEADGIRRERLALAGASVVRATTRVATHPVAAALATAGERMQRYHRIDDSDRLRFVVIGNPGLMTEEQYVEFVSALADLSTLVDR